jgi:hypothetical protein
VAEGWRVDGDKAWAVVDVEACDTVEV